MKYFLYPAKYFISNVIFDLFYFTILLSQIPNKKLTTASSLHFQHQYLCIWS